MTRSGIVTAMDDKESARESARALISDLSPPVSCTWQTHQLEHVTSGAVSPLSFRTLYRGTSIAL